MKSTPVATAVLGLLLACGATSSAYADDAKVTIFTPRLSGDRFVCSAVNVSQRTLGIAFSLFGTDGILLSGLEGSDANPSSHLLIRSANT